MTSPSAPAEVVQADRDLFKRLTGFDPRRYRREDIDDLQLIARHRLNTRPVASTLDAEVGNLADADEAIAAARAAGYRLENPTLWGAALNGAHVAIDRRRKAGLDAETVEACAKALVDKLDLIGGDPGGAFSNLAIHGMAYHGPTYGEELDALKAALSPGKTGSAGVGEGTP